MKAGRLDARIESLFSAGHNDEAIAWALTDLLVTDAQQKFQAIHPASDGNAGWVSFELDPLLEDPSLGMSDADHAAKYVELSKKWSEGHTNRMIEVPASEAGAAAFQELAASGVTLNVTLIFTDDQYTRARDAVWRGAKRRDNVDAFESVYSIFVSRIDVYTQQACQGLSADAQGLVGIVNAKRIWAANQQFWADRGLKLEQELIFASTGKKNPEDRPWKYVEALAGSDIQINPPQTNAAVSTSGMEFTPKLDQLPPSGVQQEIDEATDLAAMHRVLMQEGIDKFVKPQRALLDLIVLNW